MEDARGPAALPLAALTGLGRALWQRVSGVPTEDADVASAASRHRGWAAISTAVAPSSSRRCRWAVRKGTAIDSHDTARPRMASVSAATAPAARPGPFAPLASITAPLAALTTSVAGSAHSTPSSPSASPLAPLAALTATSSAPSSASVPAPASIPFSSLSAASASTSSPTSPASLSLPSSPSAATAVSAAASAKAEVGRATWTLLHSLAAQFPDSPTKQQRRDAAALIQLLTRIYPCGDCAKHFAELVRRDPPVTTSGPAFRAWLCRAHNRVNARLGKPTFNCELVEARWAPLGCGAEEEEQTGRSGCELLGVGSKGAKGRR